MPEPAFAIRGLSFAYGAKPVLDGIDLDLDQGRFIGVVGPNGSGKTTLLDLMVGARRPATGSLSLLGRPLASYRARPLARALALVPQDFVMNFPFTVREVVLMGRHAHIPRFASPGAADWQAVDRAIDALDLSELADQPVDQLSGGERQRAALARALAQDAPVMLLDEPTSHLDINHSLALLAAARRRVAAGRTVVAVMHDLGLAAAWCRELVILKEGRVHACGPTEQVLTPAALAEVFGVAAAIRQDDFAGGPVVVYRKEARA